MTDTKKTAKKTTAAKKTAAAKTTATKKVVTKPVAAKKIQVAKKVVAKKTATKPATEKKTTVAKKVATKNKATTKSTAATKKTVAEEVEAKKATSKRSAQKVAKTKAPKKTKKALAVEKENAEISEMAAKIEAAAIKKMTKEENTSEEIVVIDNEHIDDEILSKPLVRKVRKEIKVRKVTPSSIKREKATKKTAKRVKKLTVKQLRVYEDKLIELKQTYQEQAKRLSSDSFSNNDIITAEDGTAAFDRQFALGLASIEGDVLFEIDEALLRVKEKTYGVCEDCSAMIEEPRLNALAFARSCIKCQAKKERVAGIHYKPKM
ncbi:MAG: TraR/DksA C4-type zinc finger protein [Kiritimatiellae bacterium]|nr:TraR/DksA C4-type zinc finger protein [Kiritimatiellia bacterium]